MRHRVIWTPDAERELATIWLEADTANRRIVTESAYEIEQMLRANPVGVGESRSSGRRILHVTPLGVVYAINEADRIVSVVHVWRFGKR